MDRRRTIGSSLPKIPSSVLEGIKNTGVRRANSEIIRSGDSKRPPKMIFTSRNIRTSFNSGTPSGGKVAVNRTYSDRISSYSSRSNTVSEKGADDSFSSMSIPEFSTPTTSQNTTPVPTGSTPVVCSNETTETTNILSAVSAAMEVESKKKIVENGISDITNKVQLNGLASQNEEPTLPSSPPQEREEESYDLTKVGEILHSLKPGTPLSSMEPDPPVLHIPPSPPSSPSEDGGTSYDLTKVADILHSLHSETSPSSTDRDPPVIHIPPPPSSPPPELSQSGEFEFTLTTNSLSQSQQRENELTKTSTIQTSTSTTELTRSRISTSELITSPESETTPRPPMSLSSLLMSTVNAAAAPPVPESPLPDLTPPPSPEPPLRTSSRNDNHVLSLPVKRSHSPAVDIHDNDNDSPPLKKPAEPVTQTSVYHTERQPAVSPAPPLPPPLLTPNDGRSRSTSQTESDISKSEVEILKYFNRTAIGENTVSSDSSSQMGDLPGLSLPKDDMLSTQNLDVPPPPPPPPQSKGSNSFSPTDNQKVIKWNEYVKTTRAAIKPGTVDELRQVYLKLGEDDFKPSVIKKRRKEGLKLSKTQQLKRYKRVMDMFDADDSLEGPPLSPTSPTSLRNVEIIERREEGSTGGASADVQGEIKLTYDGQEFDEDKMPPMLDSDRWDSATNDESNPYSRANIIAFLNKRLATIQNKEKKGFDDTGSKAENTMYTSTENDSYISDRQVDEPVEDSNKFDITAAQRDSYSGPTRDEALIDSHSNLNASEQVDVQRNTSSHVSETGRLGGEPVVSSASDIQISFDSKHGGVERSQEQTIGEEALKPAEKKEPGFRSLFFDDDPSDTPVKDEISEGGRNINKGPLSAIGNENTPLLSDGDLNTSSNMSAMVGKMHNFDIQSRSSGVSRSTSGASGLRDKVEESTSGVYVVQDNVGDLYVVEDISDKTREIATVDQNGRIVSNNELESMSQTIDTTQSSIRSFDFHAPDASRVTVDTSDINHAKAKEVMSTFLDSMHDADRSLAVTSFQNDSVERSQMSLGESRAADRDLAHIGVMDNRASMTMNSNDRVMDNRASMAMARSQMSMGESKMADRDLAHIGVMDNRASMAMNSDDTDMALHEDVRKKTIMNIVTDQNDRPLWSEQTTDTEVKAWMENGDNADISTDSGYKTSIKLSSGGQGALQMITPAPDYPGSQADNRHVSAYTVSLADSQTGNSSLSNSMRSDLYKVTPQHEESDVTRGVTVTTTTSTVIGQKVNMTVDSPHVEEVHMRRNLNDRSVDAYRSSSVNSYDRGRIVTNGYNSDTSLSDEDRRHSKSYKVRQIKSSSMDRINSPKTGKTRYITRIESIPKSDRPNIQKTYFTSSDTMTTRVDNTRSSFGEDDSQYGSQTSRGTSGDTSPPSDDSPRYKIIRAEMSPTSSTPHRQPIYKQTGDRQTQQSDFYEYKNFTSEESVNKSESLWRVNSPVRSTPDTSVANSVVFRDTSSPERDSRGRYRVTKTISAEQLFNSDQRSDTLSTPYRSDSRIQPYSAHKEQKVYKTFSNFSFGQPPESPDRKRRHDGRDSDSDDGDTTLYKVSNVNKNQQFVKHHRPETIPEPQDDGRMYKVMHVSPSEKSQKAVRRVQSRSMYGSDSREPVYSDDENEGHPGTNYRVGKTRSTEDLIVTRKVSSKTDKRDTRYMVSGSPTRFDSGYFDDPVTSAPPSHTTVIRLDSGQTRRPSEPSRTLYKVVNVKSQENLADDRMWSKSPKTRHVTDYSSDSEEDRRGKYHISSPKYRSSSPEYPSSPDIERRSRRDQTKYQVQSTLSPGRVEDTEPVVLKRVRSKSPMSYYERMKSPDRPSRDHVSQSYTSYDTVQQKNTSFTTMNAPNRSSTYAHVTDQTPNSMQQRQPRSYKTEDFFRSSSPSRKINKNLSRSFSNDLTGDSGTGTEIASSDNENDVFRQQSYKRVEHQIYTVRQEPLTSEIPDEAEDLKVERGKILITNQMDDATKDEDEFDDNVNVFDHQFHLQKDNPLYQSDQDLYKKYDEEQEEEERTQSDFRNQVTQDITFETVDRIAQKHSGSRQVQLSPKPVRKQNLSALLLSKLANIDSKDIRQNIDVEHHNEEIYGDLDFIHADGTKTGSGNTDNFDAVNEKVDLTLKEGKAFVIIKVIAERVVPIDYEFNVWRKSSAIVTRQIEIDLLANDQRRRLYEHVMENAGSRGALEGGVYGPHSIDTSFKNNSDLSSMDTLKLFSQILSVAEGQGDADQTNYRTRQVQGRLSSSGAHDLMY